MELTLYPPYVSFFCFSLPSFIKNMGKLVFLLVFYVSLFSKHKKLKKSREKKI